MTYDQWKTESGYAERDPVMGGDAEPDDVVWLRDLDGTGSMHVCTPHDPGAIKYIREDLVVATFVELPS